MIRDTFDINKAHDSIYFIEHCCIVNGAKIKLKVYQKDFIKWLNKHKGRNIVIL